MKIAMRMETGHISRIKPNNLAHNISTYISIRSHFLFLQRACANSPKVR